MNFSFLRLRLRYEEFVVIQALSKNFLRILKSLLTCHSKYDMFNLNMSVG